MIVVPPGLAVTVHEPDEGKPLNATLPVETLQVGCVIVPTTGAVETGFIVGLKLTGQVTPLYVTSTLTERETEDPVVFVGVVENVCPEPEVGVAEVPPGGVTVHA